MTVTHLRDEVYDGNDDIIKATANEARNCSKFPPLGLSSPCHHLLAARSVIYADLGNAKGFCSLLLSASHLAYLRPINPFPVPLTLVPLLQVVSTIKELLRLNPLHKEQLAYFAQHVSDFQDPAKLADLGASMCSADEAALQEVVESTNVLRRLELTLVLLKKEMELSRLQADIGKRVEEKISTDQRKYFLNEQLKSIQKVRACGLRANCWRTTGGRLAPSLDSAHGIERRSTPCLAWVAIVPLHPSLNLFPLPHPTGPVPLLPFRRSSAWSRTSARRSPRASRSDSSPSRRD